MKQQTSTQNNKAVIDVKHKWWLIIGIALVGIVGFGGFMALKNMLYNASLHSPYCISIDPTGCKVSVILSNDTDMSYIIKQCTSSNIPCDTFASVSTLNPSDSHLASGSTDGTPQVWIVQNKQGAVVGCLNLEFTKVVVSPVSLPLSKMSSCDDVNKALTKFKEDFHAL